jgi:putative transposase
MLTVISTLSTTLSSMWRTRAALQVEILALRHQIGVLQRSSRTRLRLTPVVDRLFWAALSRIWSDWRTALMIVKPATAIAWLSLPKTLYALIWLMRVSCARRPARRRDLTSGTEPEGDGQAHTAWCYLVWSGREGGIRTRELSVPNRVHW